MVVFGWRTEKSFAIFFAPPLGNKTKAGILSEYYSTKKKSHDPPSSSFLFDVRLNARFVLLRDRSEGVLPVLILKSNQIVRRKEFAEDSEIHINLSFGRTIMEKKKERRFLPARINEIWESVGAIRQVRRTIHQGEAKRMKWRGAKNIAEECKDEIPSFGLSILTCLSFGPLP